MKRIIMERMAAVLALAACVCAECIPLMLALVGAAYLCMGLANCQAIVNFKKGGFSMYYKVCPNCGANLDPGERCDCEDIKEPGRRCEHRAGPFGNSTMRSSRTNRSTHQLPAGSLTR